jgi:hypothetical protein
MNDKPIESAEAAKARHTEGELADIGTQLKRSYLRGTGLRLTRDEVRALYARNGEELESLRKPLPMVLHCPKCGTQHVDAPEPENNWTNPPHKSHLCHNCKTVWRPADVPTNGVQSVATRGDADTWPQR